MKDRKLYLHVGCGKTGSSALQLWLHHHREDFATAGYFYPVIEESEPGVYEITSGNGSLLIEALKKGQAEVLLKQLFQRSRRVIFSSEQFQGIGETLLQALKDLGPQLGFETVIIVYVRDLYDVLFSLYLQRVKRHGETESFDTFIRQTKKVQQFQVVRRYEKLFDHIRVLHYDSERSGGLDRAFCRALEMKGTRIPRMTPRKINRSLTLMEMELLRQTNRLCLYKCPGESELDRKLSDALIYRDPEKETEIYFDAELLKFLRRRFSKELNRLNRRYFGGHKLKIFTPKGKKIARDIPEVAPEYLHIVETLLEVFCSRERMPRGVLEKVGRLFRPV